MSIDRAEWSRSLGTPPRLGIVSAGTDRLAAEEIYRPLRPLARRAVAWRRRHVSNGLSVRPTHVEPPSIVDHPLVAPYVADATGLAVMRGSAGRSLLGIACDGGLRTVLKIGAATDTGLAAEAGWLVAPPGSVRTPVLIGHAADASTRVLATEALDGFWRAPVASIETVVDVVVRLQSLDDPVVHGDLAPWNLVAGSGDVAPLAIDWERARHAAAPLTDLAQYLVQQQGQLARARGAQSILTALVAPGGPGRRCLAAIGIDPATAESHLRATLLSGIVEQTEFRPVRELWTELAATLG